MNEKPTADPQVLVDEGPVLLHLYADGVARITLNRPDAANGLNLELLQALQDVVLRVHGDPRVRALLITGAGKNFCAGGDVHTFLSKGEGLPDYIHVVTTCLQNVASGLIRLKAPVITAVQGFAAGGGGMGLVCSSDLVVAAESAKFLTGATRVAMVPDAGVSVTLTQLVGLRKATELLMLNPVIDAAEALRLGLITRVVPDAELADAALAIARQCAAGAPAAMAHTKRLLWSGVGRSVEQAMPEENSTQATLCGTSDALEGLAAVIEKRTPRFTGR